MAKDTPQQFEQNLRLVTNETLSALRTDLRNSLLSVQESLVRPPAIVSAPPAPKIEETLTVQPPLRQQSGSSASASAPESGSSSPTQPLTFSAHITVGGQIRTATIHGFYS